MCRNWHDAEDLVQTTFERAWRARAQFLAGSNLGAWLFRILHNHHRDNLRRRVGVQISLPDEVPDTAAAGRETSSIRGPRPAAVLEALSRLPPELRAPLELLAVQGKLYREIAQELSVPVNTVGTRIRRARRMLQELLDHPADLRGAALG